jgi:hypothetical protein
MKNLRIEVVDSVCQMIGCNSEARFCTKTMPVRYYCFGCRPKDCVRLDEKVSGECKDVF